MSTSARAIYPSEIQLARKCWRKWGFQYLHRSPREPEGPSQRLGNEVHDAFDGWIKAGIPPKPGVSLADELLMAALKYLPAPRSGASEKNSFTEINGIKYGLRTDWRGRSSELPGFGEMDAFGDLPAVADLKTSSNPLRYGLWGREAFLDDTEALIYLQAAGEGSDCVAARWVYMQTPKKDLDGSIPWKPLGPGKERKAFTSDVVLGYDALSRAHLRVIEPVARAILDLRAQGAAAVDPVRLPFNLEECTAFNKPCEHASKCNGHFPVDVLVSEGYRERNTRMSQFMQDFAPPPGMALQAPAVAAPQFTPPPAPAAPQAPAFQPVGGMPAPSQWMTAPAGTPPAPMHLQVAQPIQPSVHAQVRVNPPENPYAQPAYVPPVPLMAAPAMVPSSQAVAAYEQAKVPALHSPTPSLTEALAAMETILRFLKG